MDFLLLVALSLCLSDFISINFCNHVFWRKSRKAEKVNLTVAQKLELIRKLESVGSVNSVCEEYGIKRTVSDARKSKSKLTEYALKYSVD